MLGKPTSYSPLGGAHIECSHALLLTSYCHYHLSLYQSSLSFGLFDVSFFGHLVSLRHSHVSFYHSHVSFHHSQVSFRQSLVSFHHSQVSFRQSLVSFHHPHVSFHHSHVSFRQSLVSVCHSRGSFDHKVKFLCYRDQPFRGISPSLMHFGNSVALYQDSSRINSTLTSS